MSDQDDRELAAAAVAALARDDLGTYELAKKTLGAERLGDITAGWWSEAIWDGWFADLARDDPGFVAAYDVSGPVEPSIEAFRARILHGA